MIDTHAHLQDEKIENVKDVIQNAKNAGVTKIVCASADITSSKKAIEIAEEYDGVYATVGVHPEEANSFSEETLRELEELAKNKKVVAIGEIGLDYFHEFASREKQKEIFVKQIELSHKLSLPVVVHAREATADTIQILTKNKHLLKNGVCIHCFSMSTEILKQVMLLGFYISIGGIVTFKNAKNMLDVARECDLDKLMLETDTPYLTPEPFRKYTNEPKYVPQILEKIANLRGINMQELEQITNQNAERFFGI